jgi:hypothetical protein
VPASSHIHASEPRLLTQHHARHIDGTLAFADRLILSGTLDDVCHAGVADGWLHRDDICFFDLRITAQPLRDQTLTTAQAAGMASNAGTPARKCASQSCSNSAAIVRIGASLPGDGKPNGFSLSAYGLYRQ